MSIQASTMEHGYALVEDWLTLAPWSTYGASDRDYELRAGVNVGVGQALWVGASGALRIARDTDITPGLPHVLTVSLYCGPGGSRPCNIQVRNAAGQSGNETILGTGAPFSAGWNRVIVNFTPPQDWDAVRLALFTTSADGGLIGPVRALPAGEGED